MNVRGSVTPASLSQGLVMREAGRSPSSSAAMARMDLLKLLAYPRIGDLPDLRWGAWPHAFPLVVR